MIKDLSIKKKLTGGFGLLAGLILVVGVVIIASSMGAMNIVTGFFSNEMPVLNSLLTLESAEKSLAEELQSLANPMKATVERHESVKEINEWLSVIGNEMDKLKSNKVAIKMAGWAKLMESKEVYEREVLQILQNEKQYDQLQIENPYQKQLDLFLIGLEDDESSSRYEEALTMLKAMSDRIKQTQSKSATEFTSILRSLLIETEKKSDQVTAKVRVMGQTIVGVVVVAILVAMIMAVVVGMFLAKQIVTPIKSINEALFEIASGNFIVNIEVDSNDEVGEIANSTRQMVANLRELLTHVADATGVVRKEFRNLLLSAGESRESVSQITSAIAGVASGSSEQVNSVNNIKQKSDTIMMELLSISDSIGKQVHTTETTARQVIKNDETIHNIAVTAKKQTEDVDATKQTVKEMGQAIDQVAADTEFVSENSKQTSEIAKEGEQIVSNTLLAMERIKDTVFTSAAKIKELGNSSAQIESIIEVIDDIAEQTNLLALNAAIEAARAGDHGRGFAVVADEVRKLAERSGKATKEIGTLIKEIQRNTRIAVDSMDSGTAEVQAGADLGQQAKLALSKIIDAVDGTVSQIQNISAAAKQMAMSSEEVVQSMNSITRIIENNNESMQDLTQRSNQIVASIEDIKTISESNLESTDKITNLYREALDNIVAIAKVSEDNSAAVEEVSGSSEEVYATIEMFGAKIAKLESTTIGLEERVSVFKV